MVRTGDTLDILAQRYKITSTAISQANCLLVPTLSPGQVIYLPPEPTHTPVPCGPPHTWVNYTVQKGDTLYHLGQIYGISYLVIQRANCLPNFNIYIGQHLYVPPWAPYPPTPTFFFGPYLPTETPFWDLPSDTPSYPWMDTPTPSETPTETPTLTPSDTLPTP